MSLRYFPNPYEDYKAGQPFELDKDGIKRLIKVYVETIMYNSSLNNPDRRGDLYVGDAGIAYMFFRLAQSPLSDELRALEHARQFIDSAKKHAKKYKSSVEERSAFLCGNAGIYAVAAAISALQNRIQNIEKDMTEFRSGLEGCQMNLWDEILVGRAGYLSGCYWLDRTMGIRAFPDGDLVEICKLIVQRGKEYAINTRSKIPLMYEYHGRSYLGAAHGLCGILHMLLESPWFKRSENSQKIDIPPSVFSDIKNTIDALLALQDSRGNLPPTLESRENQLVHWCHGAPGAIYLFAKSFLIFNEEKYLRACIQMAELIWHVGLLKKGPGICHGVAGNGYVFLIMYRLTKDVKYLYRASRYMEFLTDSTFVNGARTPDRPYSLYEGLAGTVCFLVDLLEVEKAAFPFMDIF